MSSVASKNLFDLLGNDPEEEPQPPVEPIDKPTQRHGKRNDVQSDAPKDAPTAPRGGGGGRGGRGRGRGDFTGSERAFQDRDAGRASNRGRSTDDGVRFDRHSDRLGGGRIQRGGSYDGRGGRGGAGGTRARGGKDDRHSRSLQSNSTKQADQGWGGDTGTAEWNDEKAGQAQAWEEEKEGYDAFPDKPVNAEGDVPATENGDAAEEPQPEPEPEDKSLSYSDYLAQQAEKKLALGSPLEARKANEGASKKQPQGKALEKEDDSNYFLGGAGKKSRERERKEKSTLLLDHDYASRNETNSGRGGRGGRGRGRGEFRGDRRGSDRGGPRGGRAGFRGGRGGPSPNVTDTSAFPTLGS